MNVQVQLLSQVHFLLLQHCLVLCPQLVSLTSFLATRVVAALI